MTAERWLRVKTIFHDAVECDPAARAEFLRQSCGSDSELQREVQSLLDSGQDPGSLLESPTELARPPGAASMLGRVVGNYVITGHLARGGMGVVYRARHLTLPRDAVVKCIRPLALSEQAQQQLRARFRREAHIQSQLDHPNIVRVYEFFDFPDEYLLVMEYVAGASLRSMLDNTGRLPHAQAVALTVQALQGLAHAHALRYVDESKDTGVGIIHRDIKPGNLLVDEEGLLKLTDFGIAKVSGQSHLTDTGFSPGTVEYMSPEQIRGQPVDARSDLYSLGVTLYEMLAGRVPFPGSDSSSGYDLLKAHVETDAPSIRALNPELPVALTDVVSRSLKRDPSQRWQTASEFREALLSCQPASNASKPAYVPRRISRRAMVAGLVALPLMLASGAFWLSRGGKATPSIAVLPFVDMSPGKDQEYFSDGLAEELLSALAKTPGLRVAGRTSSFQFKGQAANFSVIGGKLNVGAILEGSVRKQANRARITVQLIKAADGFPLWSETYDRELNDIFAVQEEIARAIAGALKVTLLAGKTASTNVEAYNAYLQGRYFLQRHNGQENLEKATGYFERAIKLDPGYAKAWVGLAESRSGQAGEGYVPADEGFRMAREAVDRALTLDANLGEAHSAMGWIKQFHDWDWAGADASYKRALALAPGNAVVISHAGILARIVGRLDEATALGRSAMRIDPLTPGNYHNAGLSLYYAGLHEEAIAAFLKALELLPEMTFAHCFVGQVYLAQSQARKALAEMEKEKQPVLHVFGLALAYHALGQKKESNANLADLIEKSVSYQIAEVYAFRGEADQAFDWLQRAYTAHSTSLAQLKGDPLLKNLEHDPRYTALLKKMRLPL